MYPNPAMQFVPRTTQQTREVPRLHFQCVAIMPIHSDLSILLHNGVLPIQVPIRPILLLSIFLCASSETSFLVDYK